MYIRGQIRIFNALNSDGYSTGNAPPSGNNDKYSADQDSWSALCHKTTSHYLNQCWLRSVTPYGLTIPQWFNTSMSSKNGWYSTCYQQAMGRVPTNENWVHGWPSASWSLKKLIGWECYTSAKLCGEMEVGALRFNETINGTGHGRMYDLRLSSLIINRPDILALCHCNNAHSWSPWWKHSLMSWEIKLVLLKGS